MNTNHKKTIAITGATGFIGKFLIDKLVQRGHQVVAIVRNTPREKTTGVRYFESKLGCPAPSGTFRNVDLVVHTAYDLRLGQTETNIKGTQIWEEQARHDGVQHQIFLSSYSAHPNAPSEYGISKHKLEEWMLSQRHVVVRLGLVLGTRGLCGRLAHTIRKFPIVPVLGGNGVTIAVTGLQQLLEAVLRYEDLPKGNIINLFESEKTTMKNLLKRISHLQNRGKVLLVALPAKPALILFKLLRARSLAQSLQALLASQKYAYSSSLEQLGIRSRSVQTLLVEGGLREPV